MHISNLHCQFLCCCALLEVEISLKNLSQNATPEVAWRFTRQPDSFCTTSFLFTRARNIFLEFVGIINFGAFCWPWYCMVASHSLCSLPSYSLRKYHACWLRMSLYGSYIYFQSFCSLKKHLLFFGIKISELSSGSVIVRRFTRHVPCNKSISRDLEVWYPVIPQV